MSLTGTAYSCAARIRDLLKGEKDLARRAELDLIKMDILGLASLEGISGLEQEIESLKNKLSDAESLRVAQRDAQAGIIIDLRAKLAGSEEYRIINLKKYRRWELKIQKEAEQKAAESLGRIARLEHELVYMQPFLPVEQSVRAEHTLSESPSESYEKMQLESKRLDWIDWNCSFVASAPYVIGPYKLGELRKMADDGIAQEKILKAEAARTADGESK